MITTESIWDPIIKNLVLGKDKTVEVSASTIENLCVFAEKTAAGLIKAKLNADVREVENQTPVILKALCDVLVEEKLDFVYVTQKDISDGVYSLAGDVTELITTPHTADRMIPSDNRITSRLLEIQTNLKTLLKTKFAGKSSAKVHSISLFLSDGNYGTNICAGIRYVDEILKIVDGPKIGINTGQPIKLEIKTDTDFQYNELERAQDRAEIANKLMNDFPGTFHWEYVAKYIMGLTDAEIKENAEYWNKPKGVDVIEELKKEGLLSDAEIKKNKEFRNKSKDKSSENVQIKKVNTNFQECAQLEVEDVYSKSTDTLGDMYNLQKDIQENVYGYDFKKLRKGSLEDFRRFFDWNYHAIQDELREVFNALGGMHDGIQSGVWKPWKSSHKKELHKMSYDKLSDRDKKELKMELIDIQHFIFNLMISCDMTPEELMNFYFSKNAENRKRQQKPGGY